MRICLITVYTCFNHDENIHHGSVRVARSQSWTPTRLDGCTQLIGWAPLCRKRCRRSRKHLYVGRIIKFGERLGHRAAVQLSRTNGKIRRIIVARGTADNLAGAARSEVMVAVAQDGLIDCEVGGIRPDATGTTTRGGTCDS